ncbi:hypothetical protein K469DRAFT_705944 [Zopfia rhizophila CBS 207.26]|uniref:Uncharacterized protein n=1 Tax=Zopfia rhizophila CBS 207.26 TaxID=1314779 RepID=A0A6A6EX45_9PEZI|nr:hypothetical protein K469DRAFT_705944 [Zopfia rhizophila CBS 207.26]
MLDVPLSAPAQPRHSLSNPSPSSQASSKDPTFSLLLSLPRELRDRIYVFALSSAFPFWWPAPTSPQHHVALGLLTVSKQVYNEAASILYSTNKFLFTHPSDCNIFRVISSPFSNLITSVCFRIREKDLRLWTSYLGSGQLERSLKTDLPKLKSLWIFLRCGSVGPPGLIGQLGGPQIVGLPPALAAQVQAVQNALGQQVQALQQQVQALQQSMAIVTHGNATPNQPVQAQTGTAAAQTHQTPPLAQNQAQTHQHQAQTQTTQGNTGENRGTDNNIPPPPPPPPFISFAPAPHQHQHQHHHHHTHHDHLPPPPPHHHAPADAPGQANQPHHPPLYSHFFRWEREHGLENLCLSLQETRPPDSEVKIVCIMRLPRPEVQRLVRLYPEELNVDRTGDARTRFRRLFGVEVSIEVSGYDVPGLQG